MHQVKVLVTGATGDTGRATVDELLARGYQVRALAHKEDDRSKRLQARGVEVVYGDLLDFGQVRAALSKNAPAVFQSATKAAASRAQSIASELRIDIGGIGIEADIRVSVKNIEVKNRAAMSRPATRLQLEWEAARMPRLFPIMKADLSIYPLTATETQLDFKGVYEPPLGPLGEAVNAIVGHRIAEVSVHRFVSDVAGYLRKTLG